MRLASALLYVSAITIGITTASIASAADTAKPALKAAPAAVPAKSLPHSWSGLYLGLNTGYEWADVHSVQLAPSFPSASTIKDWVWGAHIGVQHQLDGGTAHSWLVGLEASVDAPGARNSTSNFGPCLNPAFTCGYTRMDLITAGARLGLAGDRWLFTVSGGWATAALRRESDPFNATAVGRPREQGAYAGAGVDLVLIKGTSVDVVGGLDYKHIWFGTADFTTDGNNDFSVRSNVDVVRVRLTIKTNG